MSFSQSSRGRLTDRDLGRFPGETLFDRLGRTLCRIGVVPRKELYEAWEMARRIRRVFRGGRIVDLGAGHGLLAHALLLLDDSSPCAIAVDKSPPASGARVHEALVRAWPRLGDRITFLEGEFDRVDVARTDIVVSSHACGALTDRVLDRAVAARARVAVLPCCHDHVHCESGDLEGWMPADLAIDATRAARLRQHGYRVWTKTIPVEVTPRNRLLIGVPVDAA